MKTVKEFVDGDPLNGMTLLVLSRSTGTTKKGSSYLKITFGDQTGKINANLWDIEKGGKYLIVGEVVTIWGGIEEYNGNLQLKITDVQESTDDASKFSKSTKFNTEIMWNKLVELVGTFQEPLTKYVTEEILLQPQFAAAFQKAPAAKSVHNAWMGGLLEHVWSLCTVAQPTIEHYQKNYNKKISRDKVLFGLMLHDAGKIIEYDYKSIAFKRTDIGIFTNHLVLGPAWVYEAANRFPEKDSKFKIERAHLMHILAAHHGRIDWGSPVVPASVEAILVHHLDNLDAKVLHALEFIEGNSGDVKNFSEDSWVERTPFYNYGG